MRAKRVKELCNQNGQRVAWMSTFVDVADVLQWGVEAAVDGLQHTTSLCGALDVEAKALVSTLNVNLKHIVIPKLVRKRHGACGVFVQPAQAKQEPHKNCSAKRRTRRRRRANKPCTTKTTASNNVKATAARPVSVGADSALKPSKEEKRKEEKNGRRRGGKGKK